MHIIKNAQTKMAKEADECGFYRSLWKKKKFEYGHMMYQKTVEFLRNFALVH